MKRFSPLPTDSLRLWSFKEFAKKNITIIGDLRAAETLLQGKSSQLKLNNTTHEPSPRSHSGCSTEYTYFGGCYSINACCMQYKVYKVRSEAG